MSFEIDTAFVEEYSSTVTMLSQQRGSKLRNSVMVDTGVVGTRKAYEQVGEVAASTPAGRHADSPLNSTPHGKRWANLADKEVGDLIDDFDKVRTLIDPANPYTKAQGWALGRAFDDTIITAATGTATTGATGTGSEAFDTTNQQIVHGSTGMSVDKLRQGLRILKANDVDLDQDIFCVIAAQQEDDLLAETDVKSIDFNATKPLAEGRVARFLGVNFIMCNRLTLSGTTRSCLLYPRSAIQLSIGKDITRFIARRPDKRFSWYAYQCHSIGAVRMENKQVVEIQCTES